MELTTPPAHIGSRLLSLSQMSGSLTSLYSTWEMRTWLPTPVEENILNTGCIFLKGLPSNSEVSHKGC